MSKQTTRNRRLGFTLVEMIVVITIIGIIAGMLMVGVPNVISKRERAKVSAEMEKLVTAIEAYKTKYGSYPPDAASPTNNTLFYELGGAEVLPPNPAAGIIAFAFRSRIDGRNLDAADFKYVFGLDGIMNVTNGGVDYKSFADFRGEQWTSVTNATNRAVYSMLKVSSKPAPGFAFTNFGQVIVPWSYNANNPVHNPGKFDLSATIKVGKDVITIGNWKN